MLRGRQWRKFRSLKALIQNPKKSRTFLTATVSPLSSPHQYANHWSPISRLPCQISRTFLSPLSNWIIPFHGPLFLSCPPWKLSQSATPLYLPGNAAVLKKIEALNFNLLRKRTNSPPELTYGSAPAVSDRPGLKNASDDFVNLPNLISMSRLISGPLLGWYTFSL